MRVAILVPTKNRPEFIERTVSYYDSIKSPHPIYIGDASETGTASRITTFLTRIKNVEVNYFHWKNLGANQTFIQLAAAASKDCEYCAFHGDDDYFVPRSLSQCAEFLALNRDYRTAQGRAALFTLDRSGPFGNIASLGDYWGVNELAQEIGTERLLAFEKKYFVTQFSTHRTKEFLADSETYSKITDSSIGELLHCFMFAINGKSKFLDCLYLVRNVHPGIFHPKFLDWIIQEHWSSEYQKAISALTVCLQEKQQLLYAEARNKVSEVMRTHIERSLNKAVQSSNWRVIEKIRCFVPMSIKAVCKSLILDNSDMRMLTSKKSHYYSDFQPILKSIALRTS